MNVNSIPWFNVNVLQDSVLLFIIFNFYFVRSIIINLQQTGNVNFSELSN